MQNHIGDAIKEKELQHYFVGCRAETSINEIPTGNISLGDRDVLANIAEGRGR